MDGLLDERGEALDQHRRRLETAVNEFLAEHKLPGIRLRVLPAMEVDGSYASGDVSIHGRQLLSKQLEPILVNHIYHELTHLRQDVLTIRLFADELGLPQHPSPEQVDRIKTAFARHAEGEDAEFKNTLELSSENRSFREIREKLDRLVDEVLILRSEGAPELSAEETKLAQRMRQGKQDYRDQQHVAGFVETERRLERTNDFLDLNTPDLTALALNQIISKPADFKAMFGFSEIPVELEQLAREHSQNPQRLTEADLAEPSKLNPTLEQFDYYENLFAKIKPIFVKHSNSLFASYSDLLAQKQKLYVSTELEKQSFPTGLLAELTHRANNQ